MNAFRSGWGWENWGLSLNSITVISTTLFILSYFEDIEQHTQHIREESDEDLSLIVGIFLFRQWDRKVINGNFFKPMLVLDFSYCFNLPTADFIAYFLHFSDVVYKEKLKVNFMFLLRVQVQNFYGSFLWKMCGDCYQFWLENEWNGRKKRLNYRFLLCALLCLHFRNVRLQRK